MKNLHCALLLCSLVAACATPQPHDPAPQAEPSWDELGVMTWNIWHGGREDGDDIGPQRVEQILRDSGADLVAMQETYGSGERIADALGFQFHPRGTNVSIHSRFPIVEDLSVGDEFQCVGAMVELPDASRLAFYSIWLPYSAEIWEAGTRDTGDPRTMLAACEASAQSLQSIWAAIEQRLAGPAYADVPIVIAGDFNSMSHLDYGEIGLDQYEVAIDWPTSHVLANAGFRDSYRECNPRIERSLDSTWTPRFPEQEQDRIDFIQYRAGNWRALESRVIDEFPAGFPSDHGALLSVLQRTQAPQVEPLCLRAVSYNIRHGAGMDGEVDLQRTARTLAELRPDVVCLQEVDLGVDRSGQRNQALELGAELDMHPAFGAFMEHGGGHYGMALLSRFPIVRVHPFDLPTGNEPRIALMVDVRLPDDSLLTLVDVHFDWVDDDAFRWAQASRLAAYLRDSALPYLLLGDFNDLPDSRTLELFRSIASEARKPVGGQLTFPAPAPVKEIDYLFYAPQSAWQVDRVSVVDEPLASDHRPVLVELTFTGSAK